jgi:hypothetical protein
VGEHQAADGIANYFAGFFLLLLPLDDDESADFFASDLVSLLPSVFDSLAGLSFSAAFL